MNNYYIIIKETENENITYYDFTNDSKGYWLSTCLEVNFETLIKDEKNLHQIFVRKGKIIELYLLVEPTSDGINNSRNNRVRMLRNLPKYYKALNKYDLEGIIQSIKKEAV